MPRERTPNQPQGQYDVASASRNQPVFPIYIGEVMDISDIEVLHRVSVYIPELGGIRFGENLNKDPKKADTTADLGASLESVLLSSQEWDFCL